jgi:hypothetical protein
MKILNLVCLVFKLHLLSSLGRGREQVFVFKWEQATVRPIAIILEKKSWAWHHCCQIKIWTKVSTLQLILFYEFFLVSNLVMVDVKNNSTMYNYWTIIHFPNNELNIKFFKGILTLKYHGLWSLGTQMIRLQGLVWVQTSWDPTSIQAPIYIQCGHGF